MHLFTLSFHTVFLFFFLLFSHFLFLSLSLALSSFSHNALTIDYATSWQICVVLATVSYSRTRRLSPIANYIRSLLHLGELRVPGGFSFPQGERGRQEECEGGKDHLHEPQSCNPSSGNVRFACRCNKALRAYDDSHHLPLLISFSLYVYPLISD